MEEGDVTSEIEPAPVDLTLLGRQTDARRAAFLEAYSQTGNVTLAAATVKISRSSHHNWLRDVPGYKEAFKECTDIAYDVLLGEAWRRGFKGVPKAIVQQGGQVIGPDHKPMFEIMYSDNLLMFLMKGMRPDIHRDKTITHRGNITLDTPNLTTERMLAEADPARLTQMMQERRQLIASGQLTRENDPDVVEASYVVVEEKSEQDK